MVRSREGRAECVQAMLKFFLAGGSDVRSEAESCGCGELSS